MEVVLGEEIFFFLMVFYCWGLESGLLSKGFIF